MLHLLRVGWRNFFSAILQLVCRQNFKVQKTDFLGYELTQHPIVDLNNGVQFLSKVKKILEADHAQKSKIGLRKLRVTWKHLKIVIGGGDIEGTLKTVDLEKILS